jgi:hypothetical protein
MKKMVSGFFMVGLLVSCSPEKQVPPEEEKVYISIDGKEVELVSDDYGNQYLKQNTSCGIMYVPFTFPVEEEEIPRMYEAKYNQ